MELTYFIYENIKYFFQYNKNKYEIYKLINNEKSFLTEEEKLKLLSIFKNDHFYILHSEMLKEIFNNNSKNADVESGLVGFVYECARILESSIPEELRQTYYKNLKTLKVESYTKEIEEGKISRAYYNPYENSINLNKNYILSDLPDNSIQTVIHELCHIGSTVVDKENQRFWSGFSYEETDNSNQLDSNVALNEGFTEVLSSFVYPKADISISSYFIETAIVSQLLTIIDQNVMIDSYFLSKGTDDIKKELCNIIDNEYIANALFRDIQLSFLCRRHSLESNALANVQSSILNYFYKRCCEIGFENMDLLEQYFNSYEPLLITSEKLEKLGYNSEIFHEIDKSAEKYYELRKTFLNEDIEEINHLNTDDYSNTSIKQRGYSMFELFGIMSFIASIAIATIGIFILFR